MTTMEKLNFGNHVEASNREGIDSNRRNNI